METRPRFHFLDVDAFLPNTEWSPEIRCECAELGTPQARGESPDPLTKESLYTSFYNSDDQFEEHRIRNGMLQFCMLQTAPFQTERPDMVRDLRIKGKLRCCPERSKLLFELSHALLMYERSLGYLDQAWYIIQGKATTALLSIEEALKLLDFVRRKNLLKPHLRRQNKTIRQAFRTVVEAVEALTPDVCAQGGQHMPYNQNFRGVLLLMDMQNSLNQYVPNATKVERRLAMAAILSQLLSPLGASPLGITKGKDLEALAEQLRSRMRRG